MLYFVHFLLRHIVKISSFWNKAAYHSVLFFVAPALITAVWVAIIYLRPRALSNARSFHTFAIGEFRTIINRYRLKYHFENCAHTAFDVVQRANDAFGCSVGYDDLNFLSGLPLCQNKNAFLLTFFFPFTVSISQCPKVSRVSISAGRFSMLSPFGGRFTLTCL